MFNTNNVNLIKANCFIKTLPIECYALINKFSFFLAMFAFVYFMASRKKAMNSFSLQMNDDGLFLVCSCVKSVVKFSLYEICKGVVQILRKGQNEILKPLPLRKEKTFHLYGRTEEISDPLVS